MEGTLEPYTLAQALHHNLYEKLQNTNGDSKIGIKQIVWIYSENKEKVPNLEGTLEPYTLAQALHYNLWGFCSSGGKGEKEHKTERIWGKNKYKLRWRRVWKLTWVWSYFVGSVYVKVKKSIFTKCCPYLNVGYMGILEQKKKNSVQTGAAPKIVVL